MSRDVYFRRVWKPDPPLNNQINEGEVDYDTPYRAFRLEEAEEWMKDVSKVVRIKRRGGLCYTLNYSFDAIWIMWFSMHGTPTFVLAGTTMLLGFYDFLRCYH